MVVKMPFKSKAQQRYMFAHKKSLERKGVDLKEWSDATDFSTLPEKKTAFPMIPHKALVAADIAGLGILAYPTLHKWVSGKELDPKYQDMAEVGGLGLLAATQIPHLTGHVLKDKNASAFGSVTADPDVPHGDDAQQPLILNPYKTADPQRASEYENGYQYAMSLGHRGIQNYDVVKAQHAPVAWREGMADATGKLGRRDISDEIIGSVPPPEGDLKNAAKAKEDPEVIRKIREQLSRAFKKPDGVFPKLQASQYKTPTGRLPDGAAGHTLGY